MASVFLLDASALVKRYAPEAGTDLINHLFASVPHIRFAIVPLTALEVISVFVRKRNRGDLEDGLFQQALNEFRAEVLDSLEFGRISIPDIWHYEAIPAYCATCPQCQRCHPPESSPDVAGAIQPANCRRGLRSATGAGSAG
jgi:predicted nucleic acid-binding protein